MGGTAGLKSWMLYQFEGEFAVTLEDLQLVFLTLMAEWGFAMRGEDWRVPPPPPPPLF